MIVPQILLHDANTINAFVQKNHDTPTLVIAGVEDSDMVTVVADDKILGKIWYSIGEYLRNIYGADFIDSFDRLSERTDREAKILSIF